MSASLGDGAATAFALLHGARNGILTIARGTLPLAIFGPKNYGYRLGLIGAPSRICQALAPLAFGLLIEPVGRGVVVVSAGLSLSALIALMLLPHPRPETVEESVGARRKGLQRRRLAHPRVSGAERLLVIRSLRTRCTALLRAEKARGAAFTASIPQSLPFGLIAIPRW